MNHNSNRARYFVEMQGYYNIDDANVGKIDIALRVAPVICATIALYGVLTANATAFWILTAFAWLGALLPNHPFDAFYNHGVRHLIRGPRLPRNTIQRRFSCMFASLFIIATGGSFASDAILAGQILGSVFVLAALVPVTTGFCIPSYLYSLADAILPRGLPGIQRSRAQTFRARPC